jgi:hypothetical protein
VAKLEAADVREAHLEENERRPLAARRRECLGPGRRRTGRDPGALKPCSDEIARGRVAVDDEHVSTASCESGVHQTAGRRACVVQYYYYIPLPFANGPGMGEHGP